MNAMTKARLAIFLVLFSFHFSFTKKNSDHDDILGEEITEMTYENYIDVKEEDNDDSNLVNEKSIDNELAEADQRSGGLAPWKIIMIASFTVFFLLLLVGIIFWCMRVYRSKNPGNEVQDHEVEKEIQEEEKEIQGAEKETQEAEEEGQEAENEIQRGRDTA